MGPYQILNLVSDPEHGGMRPAMIARMEDHLPNDPKEHARPMRQTEEEWYHGGWLQEELAALLSLSVGIRAKAGGTTREFRAEGDPRGRPVGWERFRDPSALRARRAVLRHVGGTHSLDDFQQLGLLPFAERELAIALIRSARLYQDAAWIGDAEPNMAWLLLVSAVEVAAGYWRATEDTPIERLRASRPNLERILLEAGGQGLVAVVASEIAPYMGATKRFVDFLQEFLPDPPSQRPDEFGQLPWHDRKALKKVFTIVYKYRSRALHSGTPFPMPMSDPPAQLGGWVAPAEIPIGSASRTLGATWIHKDTPILLNTFEYITRGAILRWWQYSIGRHQAPLE
jgi:hypothetical protein